MKERSPHTAQIQVAGYCVKGTRGTHVLMKASAEKKNCIPLAPAGDIKTWKEVREKNIDD